MTESVKSITTKKLIGMRKGQIMRILITLFDDYALSQDWSLEEVKEKLEWACKNNNV